MTILFISDLHLSAERPEKLGLLSKLLRCSAGKVKALYILGDLFEAWAGDDDDTPPHCDVISELSDYAISNTKLFVMRGNRDYLLGRRFAKRVGAQLIADEVLIDLYGEPALLMHGDTLCTKDIKYQLFRRVINNIFSREVFMLLPFQIRKRIWHDIRSATKKSVYSKPQYLIDVDQATVDRIMRQYTTRLMIHGHTHRQALHQWVLDGQDMRRICIRRLVCQR